MYGALAGKSGIEIEDGKMDEYLLGVAERDLNTFRERHIIAGVLNDTDLKAMHSTIASHSPPLAVSFMTNTLLKYYAGPGSNLVLEVINHPMRDEFQDSLYSSGVDGELPSIIVGILVPIGLALLTASYVILPIEERRCSVRS